MKIVEPALIPVPGGKRIEEYIGRVNTGDEAVSIARMVAPPGWDEPAQTPSFDEYTVVLDGVLLIEMANGTHQVTAGQAIVVSAGERVRYRTEEGATYVAVCLPAFSLDGASRDE
jgi:quercetin dioxygenase-like cupin family protein